MTIDATSPPKITEVADGRLDWFLQLLKEHNAAFTMPSIDESDLAVTLAVDAEELDEPTILNASAHAAAVLVEHLRTLGLGDDWSISRIEVCADDTHDLVQVLPARRPTTERASHSSDRKRRHPPGRHLSLRAAALRDDGGMGDRTRPGGPIRPDC